MSIFQRAILTHGGAGSDPQNFDSLPPRCDCGRICSWGGDYRLLVIDGNFIAAAKREPAHIIGDEKSSVKELIQRVNSVPKKNQIV